MHGGTFPLSEPHSADVVHRAPLPTFVSGNVSRRLPSANARESLRRYDETRNYKTRDGRLDFFPLAGILRKWKCVDS